MKIGLCQTVSWPIASGHIAKLASFTCVSGSWLWDSGQLMVELFLFLPKYSIPLRAHGITWYPRWLGLDLRMDKAQLLDGFANRKCQPGVTLQASCQLWGTWILLGIETWISPRNSDKPMKHHEHSPNSTVRFFSLATHFVEIRSFSRKLWPPSKVAESSTHIWQNPGSSSPLGTGSRLGLRFFWTRLFWLVHDDMDWYGMEKPRTSWTRLVIAKRGTHLAPIWHPFFPLFQTFVRNACDSWSKAWAILRIDIRRPHRSIVGRSVHGGNPPFLEGHGSSMDEMVKTRLEKTHVFFTYFDVKHGWNMGVFYLQFLLNP
jgi:hypothetical protein